LVQLQGVIGALTMIHGKGFRHGDLKPENIVRQEILPRNSDLSKFDVGELKICDMGLAKYHNEVTEFRNLPTDT
jgi:serine/threonine protein kinase